MGVSWQYGVPLLLALVCSSLAFFGLGIWSGRRKRRQKRREAAEKAAKSADRRQIPG